MFNTEYKFTRKSKQKPNIKRIVPRSFTFDSKMRRAAGLLVSY